MSEAEHGAALKDGPALAELQGRLNESFINFYACEAMQGAVASIVLALSTMFTGEESDGTLAVQRAIIGNAAMALRNECMTYHRLCAAALSKAQLDLLHGEEALAPRVAGDDGDKDG